MKKIKLGDYIDLLTDYHSGGSYETLRNNTKILHNKSYAYMIRTLNFENDDFENNFIYVDEDSYKFLSYCVVKEDDVLVNKIANPGSIYIMPRILYPCVCGMNLFLLRFKNINQRYMYYVMKNSEDYIKSQAHGTTTKTITKDEMRNLTFIIHNTTKEQNRVSSFLSNFDNEIECLKKQNNEIYNYINTLYSYWFIQYDFPTENGSYKSNGGKLIVDSKTEIEYPLNWKMETFYKNSIFKLINPGVDYFDKKEYIATANVLNHKIISPNVIFYETRESRANMQPKENSVWFAKMKNSIKHLFFGEYSNEEIKKYILSTGFCGLEVDPDYFEYLIATIDNSRFEITKNCLSHGATQEAINNNDLKYMSFVVPPRNIVKIFKEVTKDLYKKIVINNRKLLELEKNKSLLMPLIMSDRIRIED